ncbi:hypothetical protein [Flavobacterium suncheonense]|nr:hypothetical protein [Flavobacterium suncheonense]
MKTTAAKLGMTPELYEWAILEAFTKWCGKYAHNNDQLQECLTNQRLFNWFQAEYRKLEKEFEWLTAPFETLKEVDYKMCYKKCTEKIFDIYPKPLIEEIRGYPVQKSIPVSGIKIKFNQLLN